MEFYRSVFGGKLEMQTYDEVPGDMLGKQEMKGKIIHAHLSGGDVNLMASDTRRRPWAHRQD